MNIIYSFEGNYYLYLFNLSSNEIKIETFKLKCYSATVAPRAAVDCVGEDDVASGDPAGWKPSGGVRELEGVSSEV